MALPTGHTQWPARRRGGQSASKLPAILSPDFGRQSPAPDLFDVGPCLRGEARGKVAISEVQGLTSGVRSPLLPPNAFGQGRYSFPDFVRDLGAALHGFLGELFGLVRPFVDRFPGAVKFAARVFSQQLARLGSQQQAEQSAGTQPDQQEGHSGTGGVATLGRLVVSSAHKTSFQIRFQLCSYFRRRFRVRGFLSALFLRNGLTVRSGSQISSSPCKIKSWILGNLRKMWPAAFRRWHRNSLEGDLPSHG